MFEPKHYDGGKLETVQLESGQACSKGSALELSGGYYRKADSDTSEVRFVAMEDKSAASGGQDLEVVRTDGVVFKADTNGNVQQSDVGTKADLTDHTTVNESASTNDVFILDRVIGDSGDKEVRGVFVQKTS